MRTKTISCITKSYQYICYHENMITDADVKKLKRTFATKEELEKLDSRTAEGFLNVQNQLNEIKEDISGMKGDISGIKGDISGMKGDISDLKNTMLTIQDNLVGEIHKLNIENQVTATYRPKIENHEQRITKVETVVFAN